MGGLIVSKLSFEDPMDPESIGDFEAVAVDDRFRRYGRYDIEKKLYLITMEDIVIGCECGINDGRMISVPLEGDIPEVVCVRCVDCNRVGCIYDGMKTG